jgi:3-deoxy-D-manno-octulosonate 8-phosphate phosphatase (KDO 8-P phosphatase)
MVKLIIYDFDGVMTDNKVLVDQNGNEAVIVSRADGLAVSELKKHKIEQIIISTEKNKVVAKRAEKLKILCIDAVDNKLRIVEQYLTENKIGKEDVVYVGNDINDLEAMKFIGIPVSPADAHDSVRKISKYITKSRGGEGVIRDLLDILINENLIFECK